MFGNLKKAFIHLSYLLFLCSSSFCEDKIQISPIINLEQLPATFEEDKEALDQIENSNNFINIQKNKNILKKNLKKQI